MLINKCVRLTRWKVTCGLTVLGILMVVSMAAASCAAVTTTPTKPPASSPLVSTSLSDEKAAADRQKTLDALRALTAGQPAPEAGYNTPDSGRLEGWFDVNTYFTVLDRISMQPGYVLDYVYHSSGSGAQPALYARPQANPPFKSLAELETIPNYQTDYLKYIRVDDSQDAYFQYVALSIIGGQFYLWWHAAYNDRIIICNSARLEALFANQKIPSEVQDQARKLNLTPTVRLDLDSAVVRIVTFTKWGGLSEEVYSISRSFPHIINDTQTQILVPWRVNLTF